MHLMDNIKIAIIDNGINASLLKKNLKNSMSVSKKGICISDINNQNFQHGTNCAMIIQKYCLNCDIISIRILDENGKGTIEHFRPALEWCYKENIHLINLSLGTVHFRDCEKLRCLINEYTAKGIIIVAATSNSGFMTYPACFTNVIGVASIGNKLNYCDDYMQLGIDIIAPSEHIIKIYDNEITTSLSNSYATPFVSALVANKIKIDNTLDIKKIKDYVREHSYKYMNETVYEPDWVYKAYVLGNRAKSKAKYYFDILTGEFEQVQEQIDTIIVFNMADLENIRFENKNLIYLGNEHNKNIHVKGFFWNKMTRHYQIINTHYQGGDFNIPVLILATESTIDKFYILTELKKSFADDNYNAYVIATEPECVLFGLEYMPEPPFPNHGIWMKFIESQTFYKQSDLIICSVSMNNSRKFLKVFPYYDIKIDFYNKGKNILATYSFDRNEYGKIILKTIEKRDINYIYSLIKTILTEE